MWACLIYSYMFFSLLPISEVRKLYSEAAFQETKADQLFNSLSDKQTSADALLLGYKGAVTILQAKYCINPYSKWSKFTDGKSLLEKAIQKDKRSIELRFLRYAIQRNVPSFLGYAQNMQEDKLFILENLPKLHANKTDEDLCTRIHNYLLQYGNLNTSESAQLKHSVKHEH